MARSATLAVVTGDVLSRETYRDHVVPHDFAPFRFGVTTTQLVELLLDARLELDRLQIQSIRRLFKTGKNVVDFAESSMFGNYTGHVPDSLRAHARAELAAEFERRRSLMELAFSYTPYSPLPERSRLFDRYARVNGWTTRVLRH